MNIKLSKKIGFALAIAGAAVIGGVSTVAVRAAIPSTSNGQIHACYRNNASLTDAKGALRVIDSQATPAQTCSAQETALNFNQGATGGLKADLSSRDLTGNVFAYLDLHSINFSGSNANASNFRGADMRGANFTGTDMSATDVSDAEMSGQAFSGTNFSSANFTGANISSVTWSNVTCPDNTNSNDNGNTCVGHLNL